MTDHADDDLFPWLRALRDCPPGMFMHQTSTRTSIAIKTTEIDELGYARCYDAHTGEVWTGDAIGLDERDRLRIMPIFPANFSTKQLPAVKKPKLQVV